MNALKTLKARFWAFLDRLYGAPTPEIEPNLFEVWCYWYDTAPGSPEEQQAWLELQLASMERRERAA